jgi:predicted ABC-type ATPase
LNQRKQIWLLSGGNGAGKSTFYRTQLEPRGLNFVNADILARHLFPDAPEAHSYTVAKVAEEMRNRLLEEGRSFCFETVFSHPSKIDFLARAKALGYEIVLVFIHLQSTALNLARVSQRVQEGGHFVPDEKVKTRIPRTLANVRKALPLCDHVYLLDNSLYSDPFRNIAEIHATMLQSNVTSLPGWASELLSEYLK